MSLTILPRATNPGGAQAAQIQLQTVIDDVLSVVAVVYGEGPEIERVLEVVVGRATAKPIRRAVWCPDPSVLSPTQAKRYARKNKVVVAIGLQDRVASALDLDEAQSGFEVESAYLRAEAQTPTSPGGTDH
jgi:hypothetical protein